MSSSTPRHSLSLLMSQWHCPGYKVGLPVATEVQRGESHLVDPHPTSEAQKDEPWWTKIMQRPGEMKMTEILGK